MSEDGIRKMFYNWDEERQNLIQMQKCQRNWDYKRFDMSKSIYRECIDELLWVASNSPSKQHEGYFDIYWTADRKLIQELSRYTWGYTQSRKPPATWRNSQSNACLLYTLTLPTKA